MCVVRGEDVTTQPIILKSSTCGFFVVGSLLFEVMHFRAELMEIVLFFFEKWNSSKAIHQGTLGTIESLMMLLQIRLRNLLM